MVQDATMSGERGWVEASGLPYLLRAWRMALHPSKLGLALVALLLMLAWGWLLDRVWVGGGVGEAAIAEYLRSTGGVSSTVEEAVSEYRSRALALELEQAYREGADESARLDAEWQAADSEVEE